MKRSLFKRLPLLFATMTTLGTTNIEAAEQSAPPKKEPAKAVHVDRHANDRATFVSVYKDLCLDFEGDFPAIYWDHGNIALPGGVKMDPNQKMTVRKITSLDGSRIPVKSYKKEIKDNMLLMADKGVLPPAYKNKFKIELVQLDAGTLNKSNIPDFGDTSFTNTVYYVPAAQRTESHKKAINKHLKMAEDWMGADRFYNLPVARQVVVVDMLYVLGPQKFKTSKFAKAVLANDWVTALRESYTKNDKNKRRHTARKLMTFWGSNKLMPAGLPSAYTDVKSALGQGEANLAKKINAVLEATANDNQQRFIRTAAMKQQGLNK